MSKSEMQKAKKVDHLYLLKQRPLLRFGKKQVWCRMPQIVLSTEFLGSAIVGFTVTRWAPGLLSKDVPLGEVTTILITYAAIAVGFCVAGAALAIANPSDSLAKEMAKKINGVRTWYRWTDSGDRFSNLLFVFTWTALCHLALILFALGVYVCVGSKTPIVNALNNGDVGVWLLKVGVSLTLYSILQFMATVLTLGRFGEVYVEHLQG